MQLCVTTTERSEVPSVVGGMGVMRLVTVYLPSLLAYQALRHRSNSKSFGNIYCTLSASPDGICAVVLTRGSSLVDNPHPAYVPNISLASIY